MAFTNGINRVEVMGIITTDIQKIEKNGEVIGCRFQIGVNRIQTKKEIEAHAQRQTDYIPCTAWSWTAKHILDKYEKRSPIFIVGRWTSGSYTDRTGKKVYTTTCTVGEVHSMSYGSNQGADNRQPYVTDYDPETGITEKVEYPEIDPDDLPF